MTFDEQDSLIESLNAAYDKAGTITDEDIKELFAKKNVIADEDGNTPNARHWHYCYQFMVTDFRLRYI